MIKRNFGLTLMGLMIITATASAQVGQWAKRADMPTARANCAISVVDGKIYVIGGVNDRQYFQIVEEYNPATDRWTRKADMPTARDLLSASEVDGKIYVIGGLDSPTPNALEPLQNAVVGTVEIFDTGLRPTTVSVNPRGKLATMWGEIKQR